MTSKGLVLVSGATGFVGTEVARQFVDAGYSVRATARSFTKIMDWKQANPEYAEKIEWVVVEDGTLPGSFTDAVKGVRYVVHSGGPFHYNFQPEENATAMLLPVINMAKAILEAAHMVITSSFAAVLNWDDLPNVGHTYTADEWNTATFDEAVASKNPVFVYCAAKVLGERVIWETRRATPRTRFPALEFCRARTTATSRPCTVRAVETASSANGNASTDRRLLAITFHRFNHEHVAALRAAFAGEADRARLTRIKNGGGEEADPVYEHYSSDSSAAEALLGRPFISADECIRDTALRLWEIESVLKSA
ncbi:NAD dependent epimerase/dehydratase [Mycena galericulata]|nr:NAD dependent epimerase/dehydratase [Mycena galericulata]